MIDDVLMHLRRIVRAGKKFEPEGFEFRSLKVAINRAGEYLKRMDLEAGSILRKDAVETIKALEMRNQVLIQLLIASEDYLKEHSEYNFIRLKGVTALARKEMGNHG